MPGGNTRTVLWVDPFPLGLARGEGCHLWDLDGHDYVDFISEFTAGLYGHSHPVIRKAIDQALDDGWNLAGHTMAEAEFAKAVCERFPSIDRVRFTNSGTEANMMALVTARAITGRERILVFDGGYHGGTLYFRAGGSPVNAPFKFHTATYNDIAGTRQLLREQGNEIAAVMLEPMQGSGGCIAATRPFLEMLREETRRSGIILIFDEVMTSRLAPGGLSGELGIHGDLTTLGKYVGGGMSFGAFGGRADIMDRYDPRRSDSLPHAGTFNNNVLTMRAGLAGLREVYTPEAAVALNVRGDALRERLNSAAGRSGLPVQFTGRGSMLNIHFNRRDLEDPRDAAIGDPRLKELYYFHLLEHGIYSSRRGFMALSLPLGSPEFDKLVAATEAFLRRYEREIALGGDRVPGDSV
jgi:glutamate-1-semialdehyde 2,1-aminomutase